MFWVLFARAPRPDAVVWPGRRLLAALDAVLWPLALGMGLLGVPQSGAAGQVALAACVLFAVRRLLRAVWRNERYFFTSWRWGCRLGSLLLFGYALQWAVWVLGLGGFSG